MNLEAYKNQNKSVYKLTAFALIMVAAILASPLAEAKKKKKTKSKARVNVSSCQKHVASSSTYFVPHIKDYCSPALSPCKAFKKEVRMQGSGTMLDNKIYTYQGKIRNIGACNTAIGAAGVCLTPFISVAADPKYYSMGDIIDMPSMKGRKIKLPSGKTLTHPGYFIVQDTGGAIKGPNRFDFFTGSFGADDPKNAFGYEGFSDLAMTDKNKCINKKQFRVVRRNKPAYDGILAQIDNVKMGMSVERMVASIEGRRSVGMNGMQ